MMRDEWWDEPLHLEVPRRGDLAQGRLVGGQGFVQVVARHVVGTVKGTTRSSHRIVGVHILGAGPGAGARAVQSSRPRTLKQALRSSSNSALMLPVPDNRGHPGEYATAPPPQRERFLIPRNRLPHFLGSP